MVFRLKYFQVKLWFSRRVWLWEIYCRENDYSIFTMQQMGKFYLKAKMFMN